MDTISIEVILFIAYLKTMKSIDPVKYIQDLHEIFFIHGSIMLIPHSFKQDLNLDKENFPWNSLR